MDASSLAEMCKYLQGITQIRPKVGIVCGSGLSGLSKVLDKSETVQYKDIPHFPLPTIAGHAGELVFGFVDDLPVVCLRGRFHSYEGHPMKLVGLPGRLFRALGCDTMIVTNAAGGINSEFQVGDLMVITDHIGFPLMAGKNPLVGPNDDSFGGPRFPPMSEAYDPILGSLVLECAKNLSLDFVRPKGTYVMVSGPNYETAAESAMLKLLGADAVGMSTVPEVTTAVHAGMRVLGLSLITNKVRLPGDDGPAASHEEVLDTVNMRTKDVEGLVKAVLSEIGKPSWPQKEKELKAAQ
mmetsp:Transcript_4083/g.5446  ORF Transcript_4083/g.5446 Transcript_4083/m.5446 type:complete len:296 (-) Transcript_4083:111-998(-)